MNSNEDNVTCVSTIKLKRYKMKSILTIILTFLISVYCYPQDNKDLPANFSDTCFKHIQELASYGVRTNQLKSGLQTINYLSSKFEEYGIDTKIDTFYYKKFEYDSTVVYLNEEKIPIKQIFINPYLNEFNFKSKCTILNTPLPEISDDLSEKIVIASDSYKFFDLFKITAKAIIIVQDSIYSNLIKQKNDELQINLYGRIKEYQSYNVIGSLTSDNIAPKEIIISAHWDSKVGPGADDNASGISVMLEIANHFRQLNSISSNLRFIAFGAEEFGMLGSQAYLDKHFDELKNCALNINIDGVGGNKELRIEIHKSSDEFIEMFQKLPSTVRFCSGYDERLNWIRISPEFYEMTLFTEISKIDWIDKTINKVSKDLKITFQYGLSDGDHRILALSGIPVIGINVPGNRYHVVGDTPETVNKQSLENVGKFVNEIINNIEIDN